MTDTVREQSTKESIRAAAIAPEAVQARITLVNFASSVFLEAGQQLHVLGHIVGSDRMSGASPFGNGDDATVAVAMLSRIASQLISGSATLISQGSHYAGAALIRQMVEVEYLAWAFEADDAEASRWLRSSREERHKFFTPAKLRKAAGNRFRSQDYGFHCELGGHPVPGSWSLLKGDDAIAQLMLSDALGHAGRIWDHIVGWAKKGSGEQFVESRCQEMAERFAHWRAMDKLIDLPPPPETLLM